MSEPIVLEVEVHSPVVEIETSPQPAAVVTSQLATVIYAASPGIPGPPGEGTIVYGESPTGTRNGTNEVFTTASAYRAQTISVFRNGLREIRGTGYTEVDSSTIQFTTPPLSNDDIVVDYTIE